MKVVRINRMILGVATQVAVLVASYFDNVIDDVAEPGETAGADILIVGRQALAGTSYRFASDVIPLCLAVHRPKLLVATLPDRFDAHRYAKDRGVWGEACALGVPVVVLEVGLLRELRNNGLPESEIVAKLRLHHQQATAGLTPTLWLSGGSA